MVEGPSVSATGGVPPGQGWPEWVWVVAEAGAGAEPDRPTLEAIAQAQALTRVWGGGVRMVLLAGTAAFAADAAAWLQSGVQQVAVLHAPALAGPDARSRVAALAAALERGQPRVLLVPDSDLAGAWAARLAARSGLPVATGCIEATAMLRRLRVRRAVCRGALQLTGDYDLSATRLPAVLVMAPGAWGLPASADVAGAPVQPAERVQVIDCSHVWTHSGEELAGSAATLRETRRIRPEPGAIRLADADLVLAGGAGLAGPEGFQLLRRVARSLGAGVGASRIAVDQGWAQPEEQVGLTGQHIAPRVYVAFGISGAREHLAGVADAEQIVAVNLDTRAPIAAACHVLAVADARAVLASLAGAAQPQTKAEEASSHV